MKNCYFIDESTKTAKIEIRYKNAVYYTSIDIEDLDTVSSVRTTWRLNVKNNHIDGVRTKVTINGKRQMIWLHRLIMQCPEGFVVDHINGDTLCNMKKNMRIVTIQENSTNQKSESNNKTGFRNIYCQNNKYRVRIGGVSFGSYYTLQEAVSVRNEHIREIFPLRRGPDNDI